METSVKSKRLDSGEYLVNSNGKEYLIYKTVDGYNQTTWRLVSLMGPAWENPALQDSDWIDDYCTKKQAIEFIKRIGK